MTSKYIHIFQDTKIPAIGSYCVVFPDGGMHFWVDGLRHREDGPAVVESDGYMRWYRKDKLHREDGPSSVSPLVVSLNSVVLATGMSASALLMIVISLLILVISPL